MSQQGSYPIKDMPLKWGSGEITVSGVALFDFKNTPVFFDFVLCDCSIKRPTIQDIQALEVSIIDTLNESKDLISELKKDYA